MKHYTESAAGFLALIAMVSPGFAQLAQQIPPTQAQGLFSNFPVGLIVSGAAADEPLLIRSPGVASGVPAQWSPWLFGVATHTHPDYSMSALRDHWKPTNFTIPARFGGISSGGEVMPEVDQGGAMMMNTSNWFMLSITVDSQAVGVPNSLLAARAAGPLNPAGDILSYYAIGSTGIHPRFVDTVRLEYSRDQLQLQQTAPIPATVEREISSLDIGFGVASVDTENQAGAMFPVRNCFYFTLTKAWVNQARAWQTNYEIADAVPTASTIYVMTWDDSPGAGWSMPMIAFTHDELFPTRASGTVEIDALSVYKGGGSPSTPYRAVFSLTPASNWTGPNNLTFDPFDQLLVRQRGPESYATTALKTEASPGHPSTLVSEKFGLIPATPTGQPDNPTGSCGGDPDELYREGPVVGLATDEPPCGEGKLGLSGVRTCLATGPGGALQDTIHLQVAGMNFFPHTLGCIAFYLEAPLPIPGDDATDPVERQLLGVYWIDPGTTQRNTVNVSFPVPHQTGVEPTRFSASCYGVDFTPDPTPVPLRGSWVLSILM